MEFPMKIAQIAPLCERVPPKLYGGTERIVSYLTEELVRQGHEVTLFASGDSLTDGNLVDCCETALRLDPVMKVPLAHNIVMLEEVRSRATEFDVLHFHIDLLPALLLRDCGGRMVNTLHGRLDIPDLQPFYGAFYDMPLVSISDYQRKPMPPVNWLGTVHHGLPKDLLPFRARPEHDWYLAFLGRIAPEKRPDLAIEIAARAGLPLKIAAKVDKVDRDYWREKIEPMVRSHANVEFIGEIREEEKADFLGGALALLFPIDWPEPFGLVVIEAMACGTPTVAFRRGAVPEIIEDGVSGLVVGSVEEAVNAIGQLDGMDRAKVRASFERRFLSERMAQDYFEIYRNLPDLRAAGRHRRRATSEQAGSQLPA
jgi:glycosyltransferase involved in cell wall biosynthesis